jgi:hypothetical protein
VLDTTDPRLPEWVIGHFSGEAWVVLGDDGQVLSTAVLKRYDDRLREISVGTAEAARGRGLAKAVTAAAARASWPRAGPSSTTTTPPTTARPGSPRRSACTSSAAATRSSPTATPSPGSPTTPRTPPRPEGEALWARAGPTWPC